MLHLVSRLASPVWWKTFLLLLVVTRLYLSAMVSQMLPSGLASVLVAQALLVVSSVVAQLDV